MYWRDNGIITPMFAISIRYTADNDGYHADVSYLFDKNTVNGPADYNSEQHQKNVNLKSYSTIFDRFPSTPIPTASSSIFVSTIKPSIDVNPHHLLGFPHLYNPDKLSLDQRQSISAQPTYVVSAKSTHIDESVRILPNADVEDDTI